MNAQERYEQEIRINAYDELDEELKELERQLKCLRENPDIYSVRLTNDSYVLCDSRKSTKSIANDVALYIEVRLTEEIQKLKDRLEKI